MRPARRDIRKLDDDPGWRRERAENGQERVGRKKRGFVRLRVLDSRLVGHRRAVSRKLGRPASQRLEIDLEAVRWPRTGSRLQRGPGGLDTPQERSRTRKPIPVSRPSRRLTWWMLERGHRVGADEDEDAVGQSGRPPERLALERTIPGLDLEHEDRDAPSLTGSQERAQPSERKLQNSKQATRPARHRSGMGPSAEACRVGAGSEIGVSGPECYRLGAALPA